MASVKRMAVSTPNKSSKPTATGVSTHGYKSSAKSAGGKAVATGKAGKLSASARKGYC